MEDRGRRVVCSLESGNSVEHTQSVGSLLPIRIIDKPGTNCGVSCFDAAQAGCCRGPSVAIFLCLRSSLSTCCGILYSSSHIGGKKRRKVAGLNSRPPPETHPHLGGDLNTDPPSLDTTPRSGFHWGLREWSSPGRVCLSADSDKFPCAATGGAP